MRRGETLNAHKCGIDELAGEPQAQYTAGRHPGVVSGRA